MNTVVASALIKNEKGKYLLVKLNKEKEGGILVPPGGKLELGETLRDCLVREVHEELSINIEVGELVGVLEKDYGGEVWTMLLYKCEIVGGEITNMEEGKISDWNWRDLDEVNDYENINFFNDLKNFAINLTFRSNPQRTVLVT